MSLDWTGESGATLSAAPRPELAGGPPPEFGGSPERWSPEHLLLASANLCLMTTFMSVAARSKLPVAGYRCAVEGILDKTAEGLVFTSIILRANLRVAAADKERAQTLLQTAKKYCIVTNSLKTPVALEASFETV